MQLKNLLFLLLCLNTASVFAQADIRPKVFQNYPETIDVSKTVMQSAFSSTNGNDITLDLASAFTFQGKVISNIEKYSNLQSIVIKSAQFNDALLCLSKITNEDNSVTYVGRIINEKSFDGYELKQHTDGSYELKKFETRHVLQPCSF